MDDKLAYEGECRHYQYRIVSERERQRLRGGGGRGREGAEELRHQWMIEELGSERQLPIMGHERLQARQMDQSWWDIQDASCRASGKRINL